MHKDAYLIWKENEVTKSFMQEKEKELEYLRRLQRMGTTIESIGMNEIIRSTKIDEVEKVLKWKPEEVNDAS